MDKPAFLEMLKTARAELEAALALVDEGRMALPGVSGEMSVKDLLAHIAWYEREMIGILTQHALSGSELWILSSRDRNTAIFDKNRARPLDEIRQEFWRTHEALMQALEAVEADALNQAAWFKEMPVEWVPWRLIAENSSDHYQQHAEDIRKWVEKR